VWFIVRKVDGGNFESLEGVLRAKGEDRGPMLGEVLES
jgi:hypothetical protein